MKKYLVMLVAAMMATVSVNAQIADLRHELSLSYGFGSTAQFGDGIGEGLALAIFSNTEYDDGLILGPISAEYFYHLNNPRLALGAFVSYSKWDSDILRRSGDKEKVGERNRNFISIMPAIKWYWVNKEHFGLYAKGAVGPVFLNSTEKSQQTNESKDSNETVVLFQVSPLGMEFGGQFRGYLELGVGEQGFVQAGLRYKF